MMSAVRMRRLRGSEAMRRLVRETRLHPSQFIWPLFVRSGTGVRTPIGSMPGVSQTSVDELLRDAERAMTAGLGGILLFGIPDTKDAVGSSAWDPHGPVPEAVRAVKREFPDLLVITDVCMCEYTDHGHCGLLTPSGDVDNDATLALLAKEALAHAEAGADIVAPSDMMDHRVAYLRQALDGAGYTHLPIMSYAAKYASAFYGPFREAAESTPAFGDRRSYQMDSANGREALREVRLDVEEGADILMVKPAGAYLDIISAVKRDTRMPLAAYQVSGEYSMIRAAAERGWIDGDRAMMESLVAIARAGADMIITYFALDAAAHLARR
ncbi:delta-aminolevulinic acid dehydratase [Gemmatimonas aurantiaca T-27]|uniref:Delta-aminolevulinic acid dehydratase n=1 Tax=Gemmatimonas aurantiaca (strain DSM 14586 / JCM 11422 / NBRC 100505 / T-27) TaxID=379066 RepID=C1AA37_GEMAT|nr:delta-aminolevulinic acid dehydratase [Gemmatimonas aurantiaca T-27]